MSESPKVTANLSMKQQKHARLLKDTLRHNAVKLTAQRQALITVMVQTSDHPSAEELLERVKLINDKVSMTTIYRTLAIFEGQGLVQRHAFEGGHARFELSIGQGHHDHIIDLDTGEIIEFSDEYIEKAQERVAQKYGYQIISHKLELYCKKIKKPNTNSKG